MTTLSFVVPFDPQQWNAVWVHLSSHGVSCLATGTKQYWLIDDPATFVPPRVTRTTLFVCLDGYNDADDHMIAVLVRRSSRISAGRPSDL